MEGLPTHPQGDGHRSTPPDKPHHWHVTEAASTGRDAPWRHELETDITVTDQSLATKTSGASRAPSRSAKEGQEQKQTLL